MPDSSPASSLELPEGLRLERVLKVSAGNINEIAWSPDGRFLASGNPDGQIGVWDVASGNLHRRLERDDEVLVWSVAFSPDGRRLASGSHRGTVGMWDVETGALLRVFERHDDWVRSVAWSPDGATLATASNDRTIALWDAETGERRRLLEGHRDRVLSVRFSPDGRRLASASGDGAVILWNAATGETLHSLPVRSSWQRSISWSPDGRLLTSASEDGVLRLWRASDGQPAAVLEGHRKSIGCAGFDASGRMLASRSVDGEVRLWSQSRGSWRPLASFKEPGTFPMQNLANHPGEPLMATVAQSQIHLWRVDLDALRASAEGQPTSPLATAKVVILGEAEAATGLAHGLAAPRVGRGEHGPGVYALSCRELDGVRREILLWDLPERGVDDALRCLDLGDADVALLVFDPSRGDDPTPALRDAVRDLERACRGSDREPVVLLVAVAEPAASQHRKAIHGLLLELDLEGFWVVERGDSLRAARLVEQIDTVVATRRLPQVESQAVLTDVETFLIEEKRSGRRLATEDDLFRTFATRFQLGKAEGARRALFDACLHQLELRGLARRLRLGDLAVEPGVLHAYARAMLRAGDPADGGLGALPEERATGGELPLEPGEGLGDAPMERLLRLAVVDELVRLGLALRHAEGGGALLVFPSRFRAEGQDAPPVTGATVEVEYRGEVLEVLVGLLARLQHSDLLQTRALYRDGGHFDARFGGSCMLWSTQVGQRHGRLVLGFDPQTGLETRRFFEELVLAHVTRHADSGSLDRRRLYVCDVCSTPFTKLQVERRRARGADAIVCPVCGASVPLED
ncbi:MAG: WD40 repeat domain-containing protein [Acidobacteriota bacterium]